MRKWNRTTLLCMILCAGMCAVFTAGCGGEYAGLTEGDIVSGPAVSGEAVSGEAIKEKAVSGSAIKDGASQKKAKQDMSSHRFCTDTNLYYVANGSKFMQARVDGTHRKCIKEWPDKGKEEKYARIIYADKNWLYYQMWHKSDDKMRLCRAPIEKDAGGQDVVRFRNAEELVKSEVLSSIYIDSDYYFYADLGTDILIKYDLKRKKKVLEENGWWGVEIFRVNDHYLCVENEEIYVQKVDSTQWEKISVSERYFDYLDYEIVQNDRAVFVGGYLSEEADDFRVNIMKCDEKAATDFVTWEQMVRIVTEATGVEELDICYLEDYFWQEGRLYIQMQAGWVKDGLYHMEYMMISQGEDEDGFGSGLRYEKELTEGMNTHVKERKGRWSDWDEDYNEAYKGEEETVFVEHMVVNDAKCIAMVEGKAYLSLYDHEKDKGRLGCYDLDTGKFEWISEDSAAFYKLACELDPNEYDEVFDDAEISLYADNWSFSPSKDKDYDGDFVEDE